MDGQSENTKNKLLSSDKTSKSTDQPVLKDQNCILHQAVMLLADKWTLPILLSLLHGAKRTSDLLREIDSISPKMLVQTLKKLEDAQILERKVYPVVPPKVEYQLTETGWGLQEVLSKLYDWSVKKAATISSDL